MADSSSHVPQRAGEGGREGAAALLPRRRCGCGGSAPGACGCRWRRLDALPKGVGASSNGVLLLLRRLLRRRLRGWLRARRADIDTAARLAGRPVQALALRIDVRYEAGLTSELTREPSDSSLRSAANGVSTTMGGSEGRPGPSLPACHGQHAVNATRRGARVRARGRQRHGHR